MALSRAEAQAATRPIRDDILKVANHLQAVHGVRPENRAKTDPANMDLTTLRRVAVGLFGMEIRGDDGELLTEDALRTNVDQRQQNPPGLPDDDATLEQKQAAYDNLKAQRQAILDDLDDDADNTATGPAQTIVPESLSVDVLTGMTTPNEA